MKTWKKGVLSSRCWGLTSFHGWVSMDRMVHQQAPGILGTRRSNPHEVTVWEGMVVGGM